MNTTRPPTTPSPHGEPVAVTCPSCQTKIVVPNLHAGEGGDADIGGRNRVFYLLMAALCGIYLIYPSMSVFELIPDAIPILGSLDEAGATAGLLYALSGLGWLPSFFRA